MNRLEFIDLTGLAQFLSLCLAKMLYLLGNCNLFFFLSLSISQILIELSP